MSLSAGAWCRRTRVSWRSDVTRRAGGQGSILRSQAEELALFSGQGDVGHIISGTGERHQSECDVDDGYAADEDGCPGGVWVH